MKKFALALFTLFVAASCIPRATDPITSTPPVVPEPTETLPSPPVTTPEKAAAAPDTPTAVFTTTPDGSAVAVSPTPTAEPSATPSPTPLPDLVTTLSLESVLPAGQLFKPVYLTHAFDERLFVVEQAGTIRIIENGQLLPDPFLDIQDRVGSNANEQGLLSAAFHPNYGDNGRFFVNYTNTAGSTVIARYEVSSNPNLADKESEQILLTIGQPYNNHNGGQIKFGPDGYLYIGMGDGGSADDPQGNGQNPATLLGTILRIDVNYDDGTNFYAVPSSNPFVNDDNKRNEIWSFGWRNPWRFSFDRVTGDMFIADVGQNIYEEVHFQPASSNGGENYGWNIMEGLHCFKTEACSQDGLILPILEYDHSQGCSITGGYVYRGSAHPSLIGNYFAGDYCTGIIWSLVPQADGSWASTQAHRIETQISSFGEDVNGELYLLAHATGEVFRIGP